MRNLLAVFLIGILISWAAGTVNAQTAEAEKAPECRLKGDPLLFGAASFFVPGAGQFMLGQDGKAFGHLIIGLGLPSAVYLAGTLFYRVSSGIASLLFLSSPLLYLGWSSYSAMDAYNIGKEYCKP